MIEYKIEIMERQMLESVTCDKCKKVFSYLDLGEFETQEFHHINFVGGYGSVFGDSCEVKADICQRCLLIMIGDFCRFNEDDSDDIDNGRWGEGTAGAIS